jgi:hypothetical protein
MEFRCPRIWCGVVRHSGALVQICSRVVFSPLGVFVWLLLPGYPEIFVRGLPHYLVSFSHVGFIYKAEQRPITRSGKLKKV